MVETISLKDTLQIIELKDKAGNPYPFSISFRTLNRQSKTGGRLVSYEKAKLFVPSKNKFPSNNINDMIIEPKDKKNPNHFLNRTRNIEQENGNISKIHIRLIDSINGKKVVY